MNRFTKDVEPVTWIGPAILGAVLGFLVYQATAAPAGSLVLALLYIMGGVIAVSLVAYIFRRLISPHGEPGEQDA